MVKRRILVAIGPVTPCIELSEEDGSMIADAKTCALVRDAWLEAHEEAGGHLHLPDDFMDFEDEGNFDLALGILVSRLVSGGLELVIREGHHVPEEAQ